MAKDYAVYIVNPPPIEPGNFDEVEMDKFEDMWKTLTATFFETGVPPLFNEKDKQGLLYALRCFKAEYSNKRFGGSMPTAAEFGCRWTVVRDVIQTNEEWDVTWATAQDNGWVANGAPGAATFAAATPGKLYDTAQKKWGLFILGLANLHPSPKVKAMLIQIDAQPYPDFWVEFPHAVGELKIAKMERGVYVKLGAEIKLGLKVETTGSDRPMLLSFTVATPDRFWLAGQTTDYNRPST